jgi:hypothetical protein
MPEYKITYVVHEEGVDMPLADFPTKEEAEAYIHHCREVDQLEQDFRAWFNWKTQKYGLSPGEGRRVICSAVPRV